MKKILSLLALLVTTVAAMATDYKDALTFTINVMGNHSVTQEQGTLTIEDNGDGTYDVIAKNVDMGDYGNYGNLTCAYLEGTTDANGITTISTNDVECSFSNGTTLTGNSMNVKFNGEKAWAEFEGSAYVSWAYRTFKYSFGTDDFSTGGGTVDPVVEYPINFDKDASSIRSDRALTYVTLQEEGGSEQKITTGSTKPYQDKTSETLTVKAGSKLTAAFKYTGEWMHGYVYVDENNDKQFSYKEGSTDQTGTELKAFSFYSGSFTDDSQGYNSNGDYITGNARSVINPPSFTAPTEPGTYRIRFKVDWNSVDPGGQLAADGTPTGDNGILKNGGIILDATLVVEPAEEPFVPVERTTTDVANVTYNGNTTNYNAHEVVVNEYEQGKYKVTYKDLTLGSNRLGNFTIDNVTATDNDGVLTLTTTDNFGTWSDKNPNAIIGFLIPDETSEISDFTATLTNNATDGSIQKLNMSFGLALQGNVATVVYGQKGAVAYSNTFEARQGDTTNKYTTATISVLEKEAGKYAITLPAFDDADEHAIPSLTFEAEGAEQDGKVVYTAENADAGEWANGHAYVTIVSAESVGQLFTGKFNVTLSDTESVLLGFGVSTWEADVKTTKAPANITFGGKTTDFDEATLVVTEDPEDVYAVTYKDVTLNGNVIGDFTVKNVSVNEKASEPNAFYLTTTDTQGEWTSVTENNALGVAAGDKADIRNIEGDITVTENGDDVAETTIVKFGINVQNEWADVVFGEKSKPATPECEYTDVVDHGYAPAGESWQKTGVAIDWDTQYIKAEIDLSTCKTGGAGPENILAIGDDLTGWNDGPHYFFYYNAADKVLQYNYLNKAKSSLNGGYANLSKAYLNAEGVVTIELSKKHGLKINGESCLIKYVPTASNPSTNGTESWTEAELEDVFGNLWAMSEIGFGGCQGSTMSNATYNYIHILALPAEVVSEKTYTNPLTLADKVTGEKYVDMDEAEAVVTRYDDNTAKLTFKNITLGDATTDLTFTGKYEESEIAEPTSQADETEVFVPVEFTISDAQGDDAVKQLFGNDVVLTAHGNLLAEDNLYMTFTITGSEGDFTGEFGEPAPEPKEDYAINFDKDDQNNHASRRTTSVSLQQVGKAVQTLTFNSSLNGYEDHSADMEFTVETGSEVATTFGYNGEWMHGYVYIDLDGNKQFDVNADDLANSPELVAYSYYNDLNSKGETASASVNVTPPTFTAPATPGTYRIRFKIDWNNVDPGGCVDSGNHILNNGGGVWDATLVVTEPIVDGINSINAAANSDAQVFTVSGAKVNSLQKGVNIVRTADGKTVKVVVK